MRSRSIPLRLRVTVLCSMGTIACGVPAPAGDASVRDATMRSDAPYDGPSAMCPDGTTATTANFCTCVDGGSDPDPRGCVCCFTGTGGVAYACPGGGVEYHSVCV